MNEWTILPNKLILDTNNMSKCIGKCATKIVYVYDQVFKVGVVGNLVSTPAVGFWANMALPMQKRFSMFNDVYLVNHLRDSLDYSCKWLVFKYSYRLKGPNNAFGFTIRLSKTETSFSTPPTSFLVAASFFIIYFSNKKDYFKMFFRFWEEISAQSLP